MSTKTLVIIFFLILVGMTGGIVYMYMTPKNPDQISQSNSMYNGSNPQINTTYAPQQQDNTNDQELTLDNQSIDDSMNALDTDLNSADDGLSDQQTDLQTQ